MLADLIVVKVPQELPVVFPEGFELWYRYKEVSSSVADFILDAAFFMPFCRIHEQGFETIVFLKPGKTFREIATAAFNDIDHYG